MLPAHPGVISVVVADDDAGVRAALVSLLEDEHDFTVVAEAADGEQAVALVDEHTPDLVLVDVRMPGGGPELAITLSARRRPPVVVALSANADSTTWMRMVAAGAAAYLLKGSVAQDLPALLRRCASGELLVAVPGASDVLRRLLTRSG